MWLVTGVRKTGQGVSPNVTFCKRDGQGAEKVSTNDLHIYSERKRPQETGVPDLANKNTGHSKCHMDHLAKRQKLSETHT